jgi:hypothetical protein
VTKAVFVIAAIWAPYVAVKLFWMLYVAMFPGPEHAELSGPVLYFLPKLLLLALIASTGVVAACSIAFAWRQIRNKSNPTT